MKKVQDLRKRLIRNLMYIKYWLEDNLDKEDTLNKLYYIILMYIYADKDLMNSYEIKIAEYFNKKDIKLDTELANKKLTKDIEQIKKISNEIKKTIKIFFYKNNIDEISKITKPYDININYFDELKIKKNLYLKKVDLDIKYLPNFLEYEYLIILIWISFCFVIEKKNTKHSTYFLHDIYIFQNEINKIKKISTLIIILDKISNYIQFFDYEKK